MVRGARRGMAVSVTVVLAATLAACGHGDADASVVPGVVEVTTSAGGPSSLRGTWEAEPIKVVEPIEVADPTRVVEMLEPVEPVEVVEPTGYPVADATGPSVSIFAAPGVPHAERPTLSNPTTEGLPVVFLVLEDQGAWLKVRVSSRPNNLVAWVQRSEAALRTVPNRVLVEVGARRVTVLHGGQVLLQETVAVGSDRTPSPLGNFFVDGWVPLSPDTGPYGAGQVSVAGFSDVLQSFGGGVGQIALHGTNRPDLLGQPVSNGCIRMTNEAIMRMAELAPLGTPVDIVA